MSKLLSVTHQELFFLIVTMDQELGVKQKGTEKGHSSEFAF